VKLKLAITSQDGNNLIFTGSDFMKRVINNEDLAGEANLKSGVIKFVLDKNYVNSLFCSLS
jgi:hypothetical protein